MMGFDDGNRLLRPNASNTSRIQIPISEEEHFICGHQHACVTSSTDTRISSLFYIFFYCPYYFRELLARALSPRTASTRASINLAASLSVPLVVDSKDWCKYSG
jgi:hypothetical protein